MITDQQIELNSQFDLHIKVIHDKDDLAFNTWLWDQLVHQLKLHTRKHMVTLVNERFDSSGSSILCSFNVFLSWIITIEGVVHKDTLWFVPFGTWDDKLMVNKLVLKIKSMFSIEFCNYQKHGVFITLANYSLLQLQKNINNSMYVTCGIALQKSIYTHKVAGKICYTKRKEKICKNEFANFRDGNSIKHI